MLFRYDFGEKLDLTKFRKQATYYIGKLQETEYQIFTEDFKIIIFTKVEEGERHHSVLINILSLDRDKDREVRGTYSLFPMNDTRFSGFKEIKDLFVDPACPPAIRDFALFNSHSVKETVDKICKVIKIVHKINKLKVFL